LGKNKVLLQQNKKTPMPEGDRSLINCEKRNSSRALLFTEKTLEAIKRWSPKPVGNIT
jgi:hypothetical protein